MVSVNVRNCIRYYQTAEEIGAVLLRDYCSQLISSHWVRAMTLSVFSVCTDECSVYRQMFYLLLYLAFHLVSGPHRLL